MLSPGAKHLLFFETAGGRTALPAQLTAGQRTQEVYLPAGKRWRDAWRPDMVCQGGQTITVTAEVRQIPLFVRVGAKVVLGDLNREYQEPLAIARKRPDLKTLDAEVKAWFDARATGGARR